MWPGIREPFVSGDEGALVVAAVLEDLLVGCSLEANLTGVDDFVASFAEDGSEREWQVLVEQEPQADSCSGRYTSFRASAAA